MVEGADEIHARNGNAALLGLSDEPCEVRRSVGQLEAESEPEVGLAIVRLQFDHLAIGLFRRVAAQHARKVTGKGKQQLDVVGLTLNRSLNRHKGIFVTALLF